MWQKSQISSIKSEFVMIFVNCLKTFSNISWNFLTKIPWTFSEIFLKFLKSISWNVSKTFAYKIWADAEVSDFVTDCFNPHANLCSKCLHWINILNASWVHISSTCWHLKQKGKLKGCFRMELHCLWQCLVKRWVNEGAALYCNIHPFIKMCRSQRAEGTKLGP